MTIEDFFRLLLRNAVVLIVGIVAGAAAGYGASFTQPKIYSASALGYVSSSVETDESGNPISQASGNMEYQYTKAQSFLPLFKTRAVGTSIVKSLGLDASPDQVAGALETTLDPNAPIITVTAYAPTSREASDIANAAVAATAKEAKSLETGGSKDAPVSVQLTNYQSADVPQSPVSPNRKKFLLIGAAAGLLVALGIAWLRDRNDSRIRTIDDVSRLVDLPILGALPDSKEFTRDKDGRLNEPKSFGPRETIRKLRTNLRYVEVDHPPRSIVITSSATGEGKSMVSANLARVMARAGQPTLLIDADLRRPSVAPEFSIDGAVGLSQLIAGTITLDDAVQPGRTSNMFLLPAGQIPPNPSELLGSERMKNLIAELSQHYFVIIDAPPVLAVTDAQLLSLHADGALVVTVTGRTKSLALTRAVDSVQAVGAKVFGIVINRASTSRFTRLAYGDTEYGYGTYGHYDYGTVEESTLAEADVPTRPASPTLPTYPARTTVPTQQSDSVQPTNSAQPAEPAQDAPPLRRDRRRARHSAPEQGDR